MAFARFVEVAFIAFAAAGVYGFVTAAKDGEARRACTPLCALRPDYAAQNRLAPDFELPRMNGGKAKLSQYRGKVVILNFWTKTCRPCLEEMPSLADLGKALKNHPDIALVTVTTDENAADARDTLKSVLSGAEAPFEVLIDPESSVVRDLFGTRLFPETWIIDRKGVIRARFDGARDWANPLTIDLAKSFDVPLQCPVSFRGRQAEGAMADLCGEITPAQD